MFDRRADLDIPRKVWSAWKPSVGSREIVRPLSVDERAVLQARAAELAPALEPYARPGEDDRVAQALADMFAAFPSMRERGADALGKIDAAMRTLAPFPAWAIEQAGLAIRRDGYEVQDRNVLRTERHWPPSDAEICSAIMAVIKRRKEAHDNAVALLTAPVEKPATAPVPPQHDWHVLAWERQAYLGDGKHGQRVAAQLAARKARPASEQEAA